VTSVARSPTLGQVIGLAYLHPDQAKTGTEFEIKVDQGERVKARVTDLPFYDPENSRQSL
jgi:sarcosine oxidase subunit alpha